MKNCYDVIIVGGGLTGIVAAKTLLEKGIKHVLLVEKHSTLGGRIATFRTESATFDFGAQFFTVRSSILESYVAEWLHQGLIKKWFGDPYPRYTSTTGMDHLIQYLATDIKTKLNSKIDRIDENCHGFQVTLANGETIQTKSVILTPPAPDSKQILDKGNLRLEKDVISTLTSIPFQPSLVALLTLKQASLIQNQGHLDQNLPEEIERIVDHQKKGISTVPAVGIYMKPSWSATHYSHKDEVIIHRILELVESYIHPRNIRSVHLKRWKGSQTNHPIKLPYLDACLLHPLLIAGDAFLQFDDETGRTRFESAFLSGISVAEKLYESISV